MDRFAMVTGSASGMGARIASQLKAGGYSVLGVDRANADIVADLAEPSERIRLVHEIGQRCRGALHVAVTCAGISGFTSAGADVVTAVNYFGAADVLEGVRPFLAASEGAAAIAISSNAATSAPGLDEELIASCLVGDEQTALTRSLLLGGPASYAASKFALTRWVRRRSTTPEWIGLDITLNAIAPGVVDTPMSRAMRDEPSAARVIDRTPIPAGRVGTVDDIAAAVEYLASTRARYVVGSVLFVDGGTDAAIRADDWPAPRQRRQAD